MKKFTVLLGVLLAFLRGDGAKLNKFDLKGKLIFNYISEIFYCTYDIIRTSHLNFPEKMNKHWF